MAVNKMDLLLAICRSSCDKCDEEEWLFVPKGSDYGLLCRNCMRTEGLEIDIEQTHKELGSLFPREYINS